ncbi:hypothetical protein SLE2022_240830 [Rubroshorea leprosula]
MQELNKSDVKNEKIWKAVMKAAGDEYDIEIMELMRAFASHEIPEEKLIQIPEEKLIQAMEEYKKQQINLDVPRGCCQKKSHEHGESSESAEDKKVKRSNKEKVGVDIGEGKILPVEMMNKVRNIEGYDGNDSVRFVVEKKLENSDIATGQNRFLIPRSQSNLHFLKAEELRRMEKYRKSKDSEDDLRVLLVEPCLKESSISLREWCNGSGMAYLLTRGWSSVVRRNKLNEGDVVQLWTFRCCKQLCLALVIVERAISKV